MNPAIGFMRYIHFHLSGTELKGYITGDANSHSCISKGRPINTSLLYTARAEKKRESPIVEATSKMITKANKKKFIVKGILK